jgi:hypothetical protein
VTIVDDDAAPVLAINDVSVVEGNSGTTNAVLTVSLSACHSANRDGELCDGQWHRSRRRGLRFDQRHANVPAGPNQPNDHGDRPSVTRSMNSMKQSW